MDGYQIFAVLHGPWSRPILALSAPLQPAMDQGPVRHRFHNIRSRQVRYHRQLYGQGLVVACGATHQLALSWSVQSCSMFGSRCWSGTFDATDPAGGLGPRFDGRRYKSRSSSSISRLSSSYPFQTFITLSRGRLLSFIPSLSIITICLSIRLALFKPT